MVNGWPCRVGCTPTPLPLMTGASCTGLCRLAMGPSDRPGGSETSNSHHSPSPVGLGSRLSSLCPAFTCGRARPQTGLSGSPTGPTCALALIAGQHKHTGSASGSSTFPPPAIICIGPPELPVIFSRATTDAEPPRMEGGSDSVAPISLAVVRVLGGPPAELVSLGKGLGTAPTPDTYQKWTCMQWILQQISNFFLHFSSCRFIYGKFPSQKS